MPKKNGFLMYIESRKPSLMAEGRQITGGLKELIEICDPGWRELSPEEKKKFSDEAKAYNERVKKATVNATPAAAAAAVKQPTPVSIYMDPKEKEFGRAMVCKMFENKEWRSQPIVICSFSLYVDPGLQDMYLPAEIGLSAFSLQNGVLDNFARIIDPGDVPRGYGIEATHNAKKLGLPDLGTVPDFANYEPILMIVESFLRKYEIKEGGDNLYVFVFDSDYFMIAQCLEWLFDKTGYRLPIKILSLTLWCFLASTFGSRAASNTRSATPAGSIFKQSDHVMAVVSRHRTVGQPLMGNFVYSTNHPMAAFGLFVHEEDVEAVIKEVDNYKYFEELCCIYHVKNGLEIQNCALNTANRFAFSILEILTLSNEVPVVPGEHFPQLDQPWVEKRRRYNMLRKWGISVVEEEMEVRQHAETGPPTPPGRGFRNYERRREEFAERRSKAPRARGGEGDDAYDQELREQSRPFRQTFTRKPGRKTGDIGGGRKGQPISDEMDEDQDQSNLTPPFRKPFIHKPGGKSGGIGSGRIGQSFGKEMEEDENQNQCDLTPAFKQTFPSKPWGKSGGMSSARGGQPFVEEMDEDTHQDQCYLTPSFKQTLTRKPLVKLGGMSSSHRGYPVSEEMEKDQHQDQCDLTPPFKQSDTRRLNPRRNQYFGTHDTPGQYSSRNYENTYAATGRVSFAEDQEEEDEDYSSRGMPRGMPSRSRFGMGRDSDRERIIPSIFRGPNQS